MLKKRLKEKIKNQESNKENNQDKLPSEGQNNVKEVQGEITEVEESTNAKQRIKDQIKKLIDVKHQLKNTTMLKKRLKEKIRNQVKIMIKVNQQMKDKTITKMRFKLTYHMVNQIRKKLTMRLKKMAKIKDQIMDSLMQ